MGQALGHRHVAVGLGYSYGTCGTMCSFHPSSCRSPTLCTGLGSTSETWLPLCQARQTVHRPTMPIHDAAGPPCYGCLIPLCHCSTSRVLDSPNVPHCSARVSHTHCAHPARWVLDQSATCACEQKAAPGRGDRGCYTEGQQDATLLCGGMARHSRMAGRLGRPSCSPPWAPCPARPAILGSSPYPNPNQR